MKTTTAEARIGHGLMVPIGERFTARRFGVSRHDAVIKSKLSITKRILKRLELNKHCSAKSGISSAF